MKLWSSEHVFGHSWEKVTRAMWRKYPNDLNPNVKAVDVLERKVTEDGQLMTIRLLSTEWSLPRFITAIFGMPEMCYAVEHTIVDPKLQILQMKTINITFSSVMDVVENICYKENVKDPTKTMMSQEAAITVFGISFTDYCESLIANGFDSNSNKGREAIENVITKISLENIFASINEQMEELFDALDSAKATLDVEFEELATKVNREFNELVEKISSELDQVTISFNVLSDPLTASVGLLAAVTEAGLEAIDATQLKH